MRVRMDKANKASASTAGRSPAESNNARSPTNKEARADDGAKDRTDRAEACARDSSSRGGSLRASGSEGSAFKDVKAGQRGGASTASSGGSSGSSGGAPVSPPIKSDSPSRDKTKSKSMPAGGGDGAENIKVRDTTAVIPRKRQRECSSDPAEPASKEARKGEALPSAKLPSELPAPSPADRDRDKDHRDRERERSRDVERDRAAADALRRPDLSISPRPGRFAGALGLRVLSVCGCSHRMRRRVSHAPACTLLLIVLRLRMLLRVRSRCSTCKIK